MRKPTTREDNAMQVDLNSDMGESFGPWTMADDAAMLDIVTSANIACGFHGGDDQVMLKTVRLAKARGVGIGAHPGLRDLQGFGRRAMIGLSESEIETMVAYQIGALQAIATMAGAKVTHVKAHGALGNMSYVEAPVARAVANAVKAVDPSLKLVVLPLSQIERAGEASGLMLAREVFADRAYEDDGTLMSRQKPGSVLHDPAVVAERAWRMVADKAIIAASGKILKAGVDTICIHSDSPGAIAMAQAVRARLVTEGVSLERFA